MHYLISLVQCIRRFALALNDCERRKRVRTVNQRLPFADDMRPILNRLCEKLDKKLNTR